MGTLLIHAGLCALQLGDILSAFARANPGYLYASPPGITGKLTHELIDRFPHRFGLSTSQRSIVLRKSAADVVAGSSTGEVV